VFKRILATVAVGGMLMAVSVGAAAALNVNGLASQAGVADDFVCQDSAITVSVQGYEADNQTVHNLVVENIEADCASANLGYQVRDGGGNDLATGAFVLSGAATETVDIGQIPVADIESIAVVINDF